MKVIDVLNKIANGEDVCFKILSEDNVYKLTEGSNLYNETQKKEIRWWIDEDWLNEEVEIIDDKKIEKIKNLDIEDGFYLSKESGIKLSQKINEIIDYINKEKE